MSAPTVLIADDEIHLTHIVGHKLRQAGFEVMVAHDGEEAFELACTGRPNLIVTDYQMPRMDGYDLCVKLRQYPDTAEIPVIMLTARGHKLTPSQLLETNIQQMMPKPFSARELVVAARELLTAQGIELT